MKLGRSKQEQKLLVGIILLAGVILWVYYAYVLKPLLASVSRVGQDVRTASTRLRALEQVVAQEPQVRQEYTQLTETLRDLRTSLPSEEELPSVIERLSDLASQTGVKIKTIFPQRSAEGFEGATGKAPELYKETPIQIDAQAGFHQLGGFISRVEAGPYAIELRSLRISGNPKEPRRHNVKLVLVVYFTTFHDQPVPQANLTTASRRAS